MSDTPIAVPVMMGAWQPTDEQIAKAAERAQLKAQRDAEDAARAVSGKTSLVAITGFTIVSDDFPNGRTIKPGDDFEVYDVDLHKYAGKGVRRADYHGWAGRGRRIERGDIDGRPTEDRGPDLGEGRPTVC